MTNRSTREILSQFPVTRYQGSKRKLLYELYNVFSGIGFSHPLDMFSGSGIVSLLLRYMGKNVRSNDLLKYNQNTASLFLTCNFSELSLEDASRDLEYLLYHVIGNERSLVQDHFTKVYFTDKENHQIDLFCQNIEQFQTTKRQLYIYAVGQALLKKRPYNLFHRSNLNIRTRSVKRTFGNKKTWDTSIIDHALKCIYELKQTPISQSHALSMSTTQYNSTDLHLFTESYDLIYLDPPYVNEKGHGVNYSNFYHFLDGLCDYELFNQANINYPHKPILQSDQTWRTEYSVCDELRKISEHWSSLPIVLSYRSNGLPSPHQIIEILEASSRSVHLISAGKYQYALSHNRNNEELLIIAHPSKNRSKEFA